MFLNFFFIKSEFAIVIDNVVDDKGIALINRAVNGQLQFSVGDFLFELVLHLKDVNRRRALKTYIVYF